MSGISKSQASRLCEEIDARMKAFLDRPTEADWRYVWIDAALPPKLRHSVRHDRTESVAMLTGFGDVLSTLAGSYHLDDHGLF